MGSSWRDSRSPSDYSHRVTKQPSRERRTVVDLFAGVGGLSFGFAHHPDFRVVAANEILPEMAAAYRLNHPDVAMFEGDIKDFSARVLRSKTQFGKQAVDLIVGGPPCQAYSTVGKRLLEDPRAQLFKEYFRLLKELKPRMFIYENVKGLISMNEGQLLNSIMELFGSLGYEVQAVVLNAADYGVPQTRERVIVVGTTGGSTFRYPDATHRDPSRAANMLNMSLPAWRTLGEAIGDLQEIAAGGESFDYATDPQNDYQKLMRLNAPKRLMDHNSPNHGMALLQLMDALPEGGGPKDLPEELRPKSGFPNTYARLWWDRPSTTITRNLGTPSSSRCVHPHVSRGLTTREGARVQSFPDRFKFSGSRTDRNLQIGNAVPCLLSVALAKQVSQTLNE
jgi:DNA (cytosine-5)-methyltransferase 1